MANAAVSFFQSLPVLPPASAAALGPAVVVAPHPDDEALGCGGLLALLRQAQLPVGAVLVSDGTMSHPHSRKYPAPARQALREAEFRRSLQILGLATNDSATILCLGLPDSAVPTAANQQGFDGAVARLAAFFQEQNPATILCPWRRDPHPDHRATSALVRAALATLPQTPRLLEYLVWAWQRAAPTDLPQPEEALAWQLDISPVLDLKQEAIGAHRSQLAPSIIDDDPSGFVLPQDMLAQFGRPREVYVEMLSEAQPALGVGPFSP